MAPSRPNILWILSDQHNADAIDEPSGGVVQTPHLDALAARGTTFTNAFCQGPLCMPSRASMLYQAYVEDHGVSDNTADGPASPRPTVPDAIRRAGYHTAALGKMHFFRYPRDIDDIRQRMLDLGFDEVIEMHGKYGNADGRSGYTDYLRERGALEAYREFLRTLNPMTRPDARDRPAHWSAAPAPLADEDHPDAWLGRLAADWIRRYDGAEPFFAIVGFAGPHDPWDAPASYVSRYAGTRIPLPEPAEMPVSSREGFQHLIDYVSDYGDSASLTAERLRELRRHYYAGVTMLDEQIGGLLDAVADRDDAAETIVVYTSDHGELLGDHGLTTKSLFYDAATRVPLIISPSPASPPRIHTGLVELIDLDATLIELAGASPLPDAPGCSLVPALRGEDSVPRSVVRSASHGYGMWRTATRKAVLDLASGTPVQYFDLVEDPHELRDLVDDPAFADEIEEFVRATCGEGGSPHGC